MPTHEERRTNRLKHEFESIKSIRRPGGLIDFMCADLNADEASVYLGGRNLTRDQFAQMIRDGMRGFLPPDAFVQKFGDRPPEKYLIVFGCKGLKRDTTGQIVPSYEHAMEVVYNVDYPIKPPRFIWLTPIWHPNIYPPFICNAEIAFPIAATLDQICLMTGRMIQYKNYNIDDPLRDALPTVEWVRQISAEQPDFFPVDKRDLLDGRESVKPLVQQKTGGHVEWVAEGESATQANTGPALVELLADD